MTIQARDAATLEKPIISSVEDFQDFDHQNGVKDHNMCHVKNEIVGNSVSIRGHVIWTSFRLVGTGPVARLHLIDPRATNTRDKNATEKMAVDNQLVMVSVYGVDEKAVGLPTDGHIVTAVRMTQLSLFMDTVCQVTAKVHDISVSDEKEELSTSFHTRRSAGDGEEEEVGSVMTASSWMMIVV
ncbi:hypothetical protein PI124_g20313 [Phytophthora idaei]|nr:hypothetical protein PI125_g13601 [Phytophthora idaei]KAG3147817.1 hypothetical protein PI126_g12721 [Phytophthora idaei]KAG3234635.1 hypothetical protein PI124_g20313 [Phytophthora idaei]